MLFIQHSCSRSTKFIKFKQKARKRARRLWQLGRKKFHQAPSFVGSTHKAPKWLLSSVRDQRQQTPHTEGVWDPRLPPVQLPPRCFWNSFLNTERPWVLPAREALSTQPHPVITTSGQFYLRNTTWICHLLTNPLGSFDPGPYLPSELSPYPVYLESHITVICCHWHRNLSKI